MLPAVHTDEELSAVVGDETILRSAAADPAARHGLAGSELRPSPAGSWPDYGGGVEGAPRAGEHLAKRWPVVPLNAQDRKANEAGSLLAGLQALDPGPRTG